MASLLVLWDVDYTLIDAAAAGRRLYEITFADIFGGRPLPPLPPMAGRTDRAIALEVLTRSGVADPRAQVGAWEAAMAAHAPEVGELVRARGRALPGAVAALSAIAALGRLGGRPADGITAAPDAPAATPGRPAATPDAPAATPGRPAATPDGAAATPDGAAATPGGAMTTPGGAARTPDGIAAMAAAALGRAAADQACDPPGAHSGGGSVALAAARRSAAGRDGTQPPSGLVVQSVLTGNIRALAGVKLGALGLARYLDLDAGAYGSVSDVRADLVQVARRNAAARYGPDFGGLATVLVGDTPLDVQAALATGARAVGVASGSFTAAELAAAGAHAVLPDLTDTAAALAAILGTSAPAFRDHGNPPAERADELP